MKKWFILFTICLIWLLAFIDLTAVNLALASIAHSLHSNLTTIQWIISGYTLCSAAFMAIGGRLGDMYGHRLLFIIGTFLFTLSSAISGFASDVLLIILGRVGQGIGLALVLPVTTAIVYLVFPEKQKGLAIGTLTGTSGLGMTIGPTVGGLLITYLNWRWIFFINIPLGILAIALAILLLPKEEKMKKTTLDFPGMITLIIGLFSLLLALNQINNWGLISIPVIILFILGFLFLFWFLWLEKRATNPLISLKILANKAFGLIVGIRMMAQYILYVYLFIMALFLQNILGLRADKAGIVFLASTVTQGVLAPFAEKLSHYISLRTLIIASCIILTIALFLLLPVSATVPILYLIFPMLLLGMAYGIHYPSTNVAVLQSVSHTQAGLATGILFTFVFAGASLGVTISTTLLQYLSGLKFNHLLTINNIQLTLPQHQLLQSIASGTHLAVNLPIAKNITNYAQQGFMFGFHGVMLVCLILALFALVLALRLHLKKQKIVPEPTPLLME